MEKKGIWFFRIWFLVKLSIPFGMLDLIKGADPVPEAPT